MKKEKDESKLNNPRQEDVLSRLASARVFLDAMGEAISIQDIEFRVIYQNGAHKGLIGDQTGKHCYEAYEKSEKICDGCPVAQSFLDGGIHTAERTGTSHNGPVHVEVTAAPLRDDSGKIVAGIEQVRNITARKLAEAALRKSEDMYRSLLNNIQDGVYIITDSKLQYVNDTLARMLGYAPEEMTGRDFRAFIAPDDRETVSEYYRLRQEGKAAPHEYECRLLHRDGDSHIAVNIHAGIVSLPEGSSSLGTIKNITDRRRLEEELLETQKLEILGNLAGGIAHEYNNILTAIAGNISLAKMYAKPGLEVFDILTEAEKASLRAKHLTQQLLTFSKGGSPIKKAFPFAELLQDAAGFVLSGSVIQCQYFLADSPLPVEGDQSQISQAVNNILMNAKESMPRGGTVRISADIIDLDTEKPFHFREGKYVKVTFEDQGIGIPKEFLSKIFDPFFTTKKDHEGLGLTTTYSVVKKHNGYISVQSEPGRGTTLTLYLPVARQEISSEETSAMGYPTGRGVVLVMEDEDLVRTVIERMLDQCGYDADFAKDGEEAVAIYTRAMESGKPYDAVIMDLIIPGGMGGREAIAKLLALDPEVKAIVSSGYSSDPIMANYREYGFRYVLPKPYKMEELCHILGRATKNLP